MQLLCALSKSKRRWPYRFFIIPFLCFTLLFLLLFALTRDVAAANVTLAWDSNPEPNLAGYKIHYGSQSRSYTSSIDVGKQTSYTLTGLADGQTYYFAATAYDTAGNQSNYSAEVTWASATPLDTDGDAIPDDEETSYGTDPDKVDTDSDGITDGDELAFWGGDYNADFDNDGLINLRDYDSDGDGYSDGLEKDHGSDAADDGSTPTLTLEAHPSIELFDANYAHDTWLLIKWAEYNAASGETRIAKGDIDGDGKDEIVVGLGPVYTDPSIPGGLFEVLDDDYTHLAWGKIDWPDYNDVNGESWPACGDIDGDGDDEIIIGLGPGGAGKVEIFDYMSQNVTHMDWFGVDWADYNDACGETRPVSGDIDGDGKDEIVVGLGPVHTDPSIPGGLFEVLDDDYTHLAWGKIDWTDYNYVNGESWSACVDTDGDAICKIIIGIGSWISYTGQDEETTDAGGLRDTGGDGDVCFIATAAFGSAVESHVKVLRAFRDTYLIPYTLGRIFVRTYYKYSPPLAQFISKHEILKIAVRIGLLPLIGFSYSMLHFGLVITLTMLVILLGTPVFLVSFYRWGSQGYKLNS